jgi:NADH:ubiquinone oxidoreductase subunit
MICISNTLIRLANQYVGLDDNGNKYYESKKTDYLGNKKRYLIYAKTVEPSSITPAWHMWLHHFTDTIPTTDQALFSWQKARMQNPTGSKLAYDPVGGDKRKQVSADYKKWQPMS